MPEADETQDADKGSGKAKAAAKPRGKQVLEVEEPNLLDLAPSAGGASGAAARGLEAPVAAPCRLRQG